MADERNLLTISSNKIVEDRSKFKSKIPWKNLENEYRMQLVSKPLIVLQGDIQNKISLENILGIGNATKQEGLIDDNSLYKLSQDIDIDLGAELPGLGDIEAYFIPRTFLPRQADLNGEKGVADLIYGMGRGETTIISHDAGTGKSVILKVIAREIKTIFPNRWVIFVNLRSYAAVFEKQLNSRKENYSLDVINRLEAKAVNFFVSEIYVSNNHENDFERKLLKLCLDKSGGVVLIFDGFDEISPKYTDVVKGLIFGLKNSRVENLIITTRTHSAVDLEQNLKAFSYRLRPFNEKENLNFIVKYWLLKSEWNHQAMLENKADHLIKIYSSSIQDKERQFIGNPLQYRLLAEIYRNKIDSSEQWETMSLYELYRQFTSRNFQEEDDKYQSTRGASGNQKYVLTKDVVHQYHWESAFRLVLEENVVKKLKFQRIRKEDKECLLKRVERVGIITGTGLNPVFIHQTFAEYFVAEYFIESIEQLEEDDFWEVLEVLLANVIRFYNNMDVVRKFFESGLKTRNLQTERFRLIQSSILKSWRLDLRQTFSSFLDCLKFLLNDSDIMDLEMYWFILKCILFDGNIPIEFLSLVAVAVPFHRPPATEIFIKFISSCSKSFQEVIIMHILYRANKMLRHHLWNSLIPEAVAFPGILVTSNLLREKMTLFEDFLQASASGDVEDLAKLLQEAGDNETKFWLLNGGICNGSNGSLECNWYYTAGDTYAYISPVINAIENNQETALEFLLDSGAEPNPPINPDLRPPLFWAIEAGNLTSLTILLKRGADGNYERDGETPLELACSRGRTELVKCLLDYGSERRGSSALHCAIERRNADILSLLLDGGFDVNERDVSHRTSLHFAVRFYYPCVDEDGNSADPLNIIKILVAHGADIEAPDSRGRTVLHIAIRYATPKGLQSLLSQEANAESTIEENIEYREQLIRFLLAHGANIDARDKKGYSALHMVSDIESLSLLLNNGAQIEGADNDGNTILHIATFNNMPDVILALLTHGANIEAVNNDGQTSLHLASDTKSLSILLVKGANIEAKDNERRTALHHSVTSFKYQQETVRLLLDHGADANATDADGKTPLQLAITKWDNETWRLFFPAKEAGVAKKQPTTLSLNKAFQVLTRNEIYVSILADLKRCKEKPGQQKRRNLAKKIAFLLEQKQQCGVKRENA